MVVKNGNEGVVVSDDYEVVQSREEDAAFLHGPSHSKTFEFNNGISAFGVGEES